MGGNTRRALQGRLLYKMVDECFKKTNLTVRPTIEIVQEQARPLMVYVKGFGNTYGLKFKFTESFIEDVLESPEPVKHVIAKEVQRVVSFGKKIQV